MIHYMDVLADLDEWKDKYKKITEMTEMILDGTFRLSSSAVTNLRPEHGRKDRLDGRIVQVRSLPQSEETEEGHD